MDTNPKLSATDGDFIEDGLVYRLLIGRLMYLTISRLDIAYIVHKLSQYMSSAHIPHLHGLHHLLRYLKNSPVYGLFFSGTSNMSVKGYADADWGSYIDT